MTRVYGIKTCDTCRKAVKALGADLRDVRAEPLSSEEITRFVGAFGAALVNTRSTTWRGLDEAERSLDPSALIAAHPTVMKRPVIERDGQLYLGWGKDVQAALGVA
ncbi:arsenate reductase family protein [Celeribacter sp.]|uniref:arsenate reductase family protein n=1 Tax=Celeribacter sp. TaxID=1890673 RepID=UPI003A95B715